MAEATYFGPTTGDGTFEKFLRGNQLTPLPIVVVDDDNADTYADFLSLRFPDRIVLGYRDLESDRQALLPSHRPFALILDHNMNGTAPVAEGDEVGADLAKILRLQHPWGLVLPIAYYSRYVSDVAEWVGINESRGWLGSTTFYKKRPEAFEDTLAGEIVPALDSYFISVGPPYLNAMQRIQQSGYDFLDWSFGSDEDASSS